MNERLRVTVLHKSTLRPIDDKLHNQSWNQTERDFADDKEKGKKEREREKGRIRTAYFVLFYKSSKDEAKGRASVSAGPISIGEITLAEGLEHRANKRPRLLRDS